MRVLKWIKDIYIDDEEWTIEEQVILEKQAAAERKRNQEQIPFFPIKKRVLSAVAAPYRVVVFGDWYSLFKDPEETDDHLPLHLHTFGRELKLTEEQILQLKKALAKEFHVVDRPSALGLLEEMSQTNRLFCTELVTKREKGNDFSKRQSEIREMYALLLAVTGFLVTASVDVDYLKEEEALASVEEWIFSISLVFEDWIDFNVCFLKGTIETKASTRLRQRALKKYTDYLLTKAGSPWQWLPMSEIYEGTALHGLSE